MPTRAPREMGRDCAAHPESLSDETTAGSWAAIRAAWRRRVVVGRAGQGAARRRWAAARAKGEIPLAPRASRALGCNSRRGGVCANRGRRVLTRYNCARAGYPREATGWRVGGNSWQEEAAALTKSQSNWRQSLCSRISNCFG
jgi:hypothetical protein